MLNAIELRHILHQNPELGFQEIKTTAMLKKYISNLAEAYKVDIKIHTPLKTGLIIEYTPLENESEYILFRADIDALPIKEETNAAFKSHNGNMHACGHDVHMAILYGLIDYVFKTKIQKNILFLFQPAEEGGGGALKIIESGILDKFNITKAYALHVTDEYEKGTIATTEGVLFASAVEIDIEFFGKKSHIAFPQDGINAFNALRIFLDSVDRLNLNPVEPILFGIGKVISGDVRNVIPSYAKLEGSIRSLSLDYTDKYINRLENILKSVKQSMGIDYKITIGSRYKEVINNKELYNEFIKKLSDDFKIIDCGYKMTGEDFGFIAENYPALMFWIGTRTDKKVGLHSPLFLPDDDVIEIGIKAFQKILV